MEFVKLVLAKYFFGYFMQSASAFLSVYAFNRKKAEIAKLLVLSNLFAFFIYVMRKLPLVFGVHTLILSAIMYVLGVFILKCNVYLTIIAVFYNTVMITAFEISTSLIIGRLVGFDNLKDFTSDNLNLAIVGIPANLLFLIVTYIIYFCRNKKNSNNNHMLEFLM